MMMVTFKLGFKQLYRNSFIMVSAGLKQNAVISLTLILLYAIGIMLLLFNFMLGITIYMVFYLCIFPAFRSLLIQFCIFPVIKKYMIDPYYEKHPEEARKAKQTLNIMEEEETGESVFQDKLPTAGVSAKPDDMEDDAI